MSDPPEESLFQEHGASLYWLQQCYDGWFEVDILTCHKFISERKANEVLAHSEATLASRERTMLARLYTAGPAIK